MTALSLLNFISVLVWATEAFRVHPFLVRKDSWVFSSAIFRHQILLHAASGRPGDFNVGQEAPSRVPVQRVYETYRWNYKNPKRSSDDRDPVYYSINYRVDGPSDGRPILLVHGFGANVNHFRYQFPALTEAGCRVYAVDLLGFGASDKPGNASYSMELFAQLLEDFILDQRQNSPSASSSNRPWVLAGNSIGGLCCLMVAQQLPKCSQGVILFNCSGGMTGFRYEDVPWYLWPVLFFIQKVVIQGPFGSYFFANFRTRENVETILRRQGVYGSKGADKVDEELLEILLAPADDEGARDVFLNVFAGPPGPTPESILPSLQCPILALWGQDDPWTPVDAGMHPATGLAAYYYQQDSDSSSVTKGKKPDGFFKLDVLPGVGHCPHDEVPDIVNQKMVEWMAQIQDQYQPSK